ncbi:hypothetical protein L211DRAFT_332209 [Terfezia boudieri ATCC MYA-4762]|uniref:Uncharacterized protein n=1 Tax=Terfezia boudieri ATCC MYA-4762 TaxID=1051890 RepID=A0A3N4LI61_9PEZI|nr:hypothetical protein L211DRAFT_332209 [Terfezia boudieri ATCC MYA-4762]
MPPAGGMCCPRAADARERPRTYTQQRTFFSKGSRPDTRAPLCHPLLHFFGLFTLQIALFFSLQISSNLLVSLSDCREYRSLSKASIVT